jgi:hypothetical protein
MQKFVNHENHSSENYSRFFETLNNSTMPRRNVQRHQTPSKLVKHIKCVFNWKDNESYGSTVLQSDLQVTLSYASAKKSWHFALEKCFLSLCRSEGKNGSGLKEVLKKDRGNGVFSCSLNVLCWITKILDSFRKQRLNEIVKSPTVLMVQSGRLYAVITSSLFPPLFPALQLHHLSSQFSSFSPADLMNLSTPNFFPLPEIKSQIKFVNLWTS